MNHEIYNNSQTPTNPIHNNHQPLPAKLNPQMNSTMGQVAPPGPYHSSGTPMSQQQLLSSSQNFNSLAQHQNLNNQQQIQQQTPNLQTQANFNGGQVQNQFQASQQMQSSMNSASKSQSMQLSATLNIQRPSQNMQDERVTSQFQLPIQNQPQTSVAQGNAQLTQQVQQQVSNQQPQTQTQGNNTHHQQPQANQPKGENKDAAGGASAIYKQVDVLIIGGGPAALGIMVNGIKTNRLNELLQGDGVAIVDAGLNFGGGLLSHYGINSNTSGGGFLKCAFKKQKDKNKEAKDEFSAYAQKQLPHQDKKGGAHTKQPVKKKKAGQQQSNNINHQTEDLTHAGQSNSRQQLNPPNNDRRKTMSQLTQQQQLQNQQQQQQQQLTQLLNQASIQAAQTLRGPALEQMLQNPYAQQLMTSQQQVAPTGPFKKKEDIEIFPPYRDLYHSHIGKVLKEFGKNTAPLGLIGHFLNYAGNHLLSYIYQTTKKKIFYPLHKAISVQLMQNGEILTKVKRQQVEVNEEGEFVQFVETDQIVCFRSKAVVISNGGVQGLHPELFNWFPNLDPSKTIPSDPFLRSGLYCSTMRKIKEQNLKKIVIIGGSHSGFSCAWMLLNGPAAYYKNNAGLHIQKEPNAQRKQIKNCIDCCQCGAAQIVSKKNKEATKGGKDKTKDVHMESQLSPQGKEGMGGGTNCKCTCICFGFFHYDEWGFDYEELIPKYEDYAIEILYRDHIRVFYNKVSDAEQDGYAEYEPSKFAKKDGYLYSFTGLRGDAKELYLRIMRGQERRVALIQAKTVEEQRPYVERADIVIWACGYQTKKLIIKDTDRRRLQLSQKVDNTQFDVDGKCRIMLADGQVLSKVYGCGIAYPVRTKDGMLVSNPNMTNPRADGFSLYMGFVGDQMLKNLLPKNKYAKNSVHKMIPQRKENQGASQGSTENNQMSQKNYQQIVRARLQQYKNTVKSALDGGIDERNVLRHKSLNAREEIHNNLRRSQLGGPSQDHQMQDANGGNQDSQEFQMHVDQMQSNMDELINQKRKLSGANNSIAPGSKSVDRAASKNGNFQNKLAQMARSPQILQKKQQHVLKSQNQQSNPLYQTNGQQLQQINENFQYSGSDNVQVLSQQTHQQHIQQRINKAKNDQIKKVKSPYNQGQHKNTTKLNKMANANQDIGQIHNQVPSRQGRDIMRSQQANRQQNQMKSTEPPFKMHRSQNINSQGAHQMSIKQKKTIQLQNQQQQMNQMMFNNQLYNSSGANLIGNMQLQNMNDPHGNGIQQINSMRQDRQGGIELPPILHPLNQNHYVGMQSANQRAAAANEYYMNSMTTTSNDQQQNRNLYNLTQGQDEFNGGYAYRQINYTQYNNYDGGNGLQNPMNYDYIIQTEAQRKQQEFTPSHKSHSKRNSQALYVQNDDYLSDDEEAEQSPDPKQRSKKQTSNKKRFEKQQSQTLNTQFKNLTLDEHPYRYQIEQNDSDEDDDIDRAAHNQFTLADDPNYQGSDFENEEDEPHRPRKNPHQLLTENHQMLNADINEASSSHYVEGESDHENEEAVSFGDDVSSEGSCIASNSYKRSHLDRTKGGEYENGNGGYDDDFNLMDEYDRDREEEEEEQRRQGEEDENVDIPDEEMQDTPRKGMNTLPIQDREMLPLAGSKNQICVSSKRQGASNENQQPTIQSQNEEDLQNSQQQSLQCQSINTNNSSNIQIAPTQALQKNQVNIRSDKAQQQKYIQASNNQLLQPNSNQINDYKKQFVKKQLSPVLLNRNSTNNLSNQKPSIRESQELLRDKRPSGGLGDSNKKKYLNPGIGSTAATNKKFTANQFTASNKMEDTPMIDLSQPSTTQSQNASHSTPTASNHSQINQQRGRQQNATSNESGMKTFNTKNQLQQQLQAQQQEYVKRNYLGGAAANQTNLTGSQFTLGTSNKSSNNLAHTLKKKLAGGSHQLQSQSNNYYQSHKNNNSSLNNGNQVFQATVNASHLLQGAGFNIEDSLGSSNGFGGSTQSQQLTGNNFGTGIKTPGSYKSYGLNQGIGVTANGGAGGFHQSRFGNSSMQHQLSTNQNQQQQQIFRVNPQQQNQAVV